MKNLTIEQLATKRSNGKTANTKNKYNMFVMENFSKDDYINFNQLACDLEMKNTARYEGSDSMVR